MDLPKKVVWITGASSGIGEALAYEFNKKGAYVILSARRTEELDRVKENCENAEETVRILPLDLTEQSTFPEKVEEAKTFFGTVDMLINNGGVSQRAYAVNSTMESIRRLMEVNFFGSVALTKALLPTFVDQRSGHIVVISSVMGKLGTKYRSAYAASKHALHGWFDCLRQEVYDDNIDVTLVCPGYIKTNITYNALTAEGEKYKQMGDAHKKAMTPSEFAQKLLPKLAKRKEEVYIGGTEILSIYVKRLSLTLLNKILRRVKVT
ncbi:MAG: SDR family oxidoreductase [Bacteroidetes bacterium]|jgi:short-subunit dehydrogenase|nr:SDR family oxidoreductase [Bacteroidota bacterium]